MGREMGIRLSRCLTDKKGMDGISSVIYDMFFSVVDVINGIFILAMTWTEIEVLDDTFCDKVKVKAFTV